MLGLSHLLAQSADGRAPANGDEATPAPIFLDVLREHLDVLNHPEALERLLLQINVVWAVIFIIIGTLSVANGYRWHKMVIALIAGLGGVWAGLALGSSVGSGSVVAVCLGALAALLSWPLLRYAVALFGGLLGAFAGANVWTAIGQPPEQHQVGAIVGLVILGMLAFLAFRGVVICLTSIGGATLIVLGALATMIEVEPWRESIIRSIHENTLLVPIVVASAASIGAVLQFGGGVRGLNQLADKANTRSPQKAAA